MNLGIVTLATLIGIWTARFLRRRSGSPIIGVGGGFITSCVMLLLIFSPYVKADQEAAQHKKAETQRQAAESKRLKEAAECRQSLNCWSKKHSVAAIMKCRDQIEHLAKYQAEWTAGILAARFTYSQWKNVAQGIITYSGDKIKFQNDFGVWANQVYECDYDTQNDTALAVRAQPGRLS